jgi:hypothetical protein
MAYRNGIYVAFNGCGTAVPTESDIGYYDLLKAWDANKNIDFEFVDSHDKTCKVRDDSLTSTLKDRLSERLKDSKLFFLIVTKNTKNSSKILDYEIASAIDTRKIPVVVAYVGETLIKEVSQDLIDMLPKVLQERINNKTAKIHFIPFKLKDIKIAFESFGVNETNNKEDYHEDNEKQTRSKAIIEAVNRRF